jgi:hypothetical protein
MKTGAGETHYIEDNKKITGEFSSESMQVKIQWRDSFKCRKRKIKIVKLELYI